MIVGPGGRTLIKGVGTEETKSKGYRKDSYFVSSLSSSRVGSKKENESASTGKPNQPGKNGAVWGRQQLQLQLQQQLQQEATGAQRFCQASIQIGRFYSASWTIRSLECTRRRNSSRRSSFTVQHTFRVHKNPPPLRIGRTGNRQPKPRSYTKIQSNNTKNTIMII
jgi:hypothetical protein